MPQENNIKKNTTDFSSFTLSMEQNAEKKVTVNEQNKDIFKTMDFTHQNLSQDFHTVNQKPVKEDKFADFMSIVDERYEKDRIEHIKSEEALPVKANEK